MKTQSEDKWLLVSCLQKSIRKGFKDLAQHYAEKLYDSERSYLVYRLSMIAIEDIGLGNIDLVHNFLSTEIRKANIEERGGKDYIMGIVAELASSIKDRSACDVVALTYLDKNNLNIANGKNFEEIFIDDSFSIVSRVLAGWEILGAKKLFNPLVSNIEKNDLERFLDLNAKIIKNEKILDIMRFAHQIHREPHFISIGLLYCIYDKELKSQATIGKYTTGQTVDSKNTIRLIQNKWLIDGVDLHTKEGKSAIIEFSKEKTEVTEYIKTIVSDNDSIIEALGSLLFRKCGHQVDRRLFYPSAVNILKATEDLHFKNITSNENADFFKAIKLLEKDMNLLSDKIEKQFIMADPKYFPF